MSFTDVVLCRNFLSDHDPEQDNSNHRIPVVSLGQEVTEADGLSNRPDQRQQPSDGENRGYPSKSKPQSLSKCWVDNLYSMQKQNSNIIQWMIF